MVASLKRIMVLMVLKVTAVMTIKMIVFPGEVVQWLRTFVLAEDPGSVFRTLYDSL